MSLDSVRDRGEGRVSFIDFYTYGQYDHLNSSGLKLQIAVLLYLQMSEKVLSTQS